MLATLDDRGSLGNLCLGVTGELGRYNDMTQNSGDMGSFSIPIDLTAVPIATGPPVAIAPGQSWNFQAWFRDVGGTSNFTDGVNIQFF
ncbi:MAG: hypothetical protein GY711_28000 [bacterium]|nr:hypothetical protein [bacterium]